MINFTMDVDDCYVSVVGAFGRYQIITCIITSLYGFSAPAFAVLPVFLAANVTKLQQINARVENNCSILYEWELLDKIWISNMIQAMYFGGFLVGVVFIGQLSDKFGRKIVLKVGLCIMFPVCFLSSYSTSWEMFAAFRFFTGFFSGGFGLVLYVFMQENVGREWWAISAAINGLIFPLGIVTFSFLAYFVPPWRNLVQIMAALQIPPLVYVLFLKESPRWLYSKNRIKEAEEILVYIAKKNGVKDPVCNLKPLKQDKVGQNPTLFDVIKNWITFQRLLVMAYLWFVNSFVYYAITLAAGELNSNVYVSTALSGVVEMPVHIISPWFYNRKWCGRRRGVSISLLVAGFACLFLMAFRPEESSNLKMAVGLLGKMAITCSFYGIYIYTPELFPTSVRNVAMGSVSMCARVGGILSSFAKSFIHLHPMVGYFTFGACGLSAGLLTLALPETLGRKPPNSFQEIQRDSSLEKNEFFMTLKSSNGNFHEKTQLLDSDAEDEDVL